MNYKSDIEIDQSCEMRHIDEIARVAYKAGLRRYAGLHCQDPVQLFRRPHKAGRTGGL